MPLVAPKDTIQKTYRLEMKQADDLERLAKCVGRTQNELVVLALQELLFQNRKYFLHDMIEDDCIKLLENAVVKMRENFQYKHGRIALEVNKGDGDTTFDYHFYVNNSRGVIVFDQSGTLDVTDKKEWNKYLDRLVNWIAEYIDLEDDQLQNYFKKRFNVR